MGWFLNAYCSYNSYFDKLPGNNGYLDSFYSIIHLCDSTNFLGAVAELIDNWITYSFVNIVKEMEPEYKERL